MSIPRIYPKALEYRASYIIASSIESITYVNEVHAMGKKLKLPSYIDEELLPLTIYFTIVPKTLSKARGFSHYLYLDINRDSIVYVNNRPYAGYDINHKLIKLPVYNKYFVEVEVLKTGPSGESYEKPIINEIIFIEVNEKLWSLGWTLKYIAEALPYIEDNSIRYEVASIVNDVIKESGIQGIDLESFKFLIKYILPNLGTYPGLVNELKRMVFTDRKDLVNIFRETSIDEDRIDHLMKKLTNLLDNVRRKYWKEGRIYAVSHSHIDVAWLWSEEETVYKVLKTFLNVLNLMKYYNEIYYIQSTPLYFQWIKERYPSVYEEVKKAVAKGRLEPIGGTWVESDVVLTGLESLVRQFFYGQRFYLKEFGFKTRIAWLPDSFGFNPILPQIMKSAGIEYFSTHKLCWNKYNEFPHNIFYWRGIDGTTILTQLIHQGYGVDITPKDIIELWRNYKDKNLYPRPLLAYGFSDGGGGPTYSHIEKLKVYNQVPLMPTIDFGPLREYIRELEKTLSKRKDVPIWSGELYLEAHRGVYTTNLKIKKLVYEAEKTLRYLETIASLAWLLGKEYPLEKIDRLWTVLLKHEFHDTLSGTCTHTVYEKVYRELDSIIEEAKEELRNSIDYIIEKLGLQKGLLLVNPTSINRVEYIDVLDSSKNKRVYRVTLKPYSFKVVQDEEKTIVKDSIVVKEFKDSIMVENKYYIIEITRNGVVNKIIYKPLNRNVLLKPSNILYAYIDKPHNWDAWEIDEDTLSMDTRIKDDSKAEVIEYSPLKTVIRVSWRFRDSTITEDIIVYADKKNIDFKVYFDWREKNTLVKAWFYPDINTDQGLFDVGAGYITRPSHRNTSWERAKYEVYKHKWVAVKDDQLVFGLVSHERNGVTVYFNEIGLSLLKTPTYPNPLSDIGKLETYYSICICNSIKELYEISYSLSHELLTIDYSSKDKTSNGIKEIQLINIEGDVIVENIKKCHEEECIVVRMYNPLNKYSRVKLKFNPILFSPSHCTESNILEEDLGNIRIDNGVITIVLKPFEIKTIKIYK